jgi:ribonuclease HI
MKQTEDARALKIAADIMQAAGLCRYDSPLKCRRLYTDSKTCSKCIKQWLITKARKELKKEE